MKVLVTKMYAFDSSEEFVDVKGQVGLKKLARELDKEAHGDNGELAWVAFEFKGYVRTFDNPNYAYQEVSG